jgi:hypothetical protein
LEAENRVLDADREAFGDVRVMVNMNQTGETAGVAAVFSSLSVAPLYWKIKEKAPGDYRLMNSFCKYCVLSVATL